MKKTFAVVIALVAILVVGVGVAAAYNGFTTNLPLLPEVLLIGYDMNCDDVVDETEIIGAVPIADARDLTFDPDAFTVTFELYPGADSHRVDVWWGGYGPGYFVYDVYPYQTYHHHVFGEYCPNCGDSANQVMVGSLGEMSTAKYVGDFPECCSTWLNLDKVLWMLSVTPETYELVYDPVHEVYEYVYTIIAEPAATDWFYMLFY